MSAAYQWTPNLVSSTFSFERMRYNPRYNHSLDFKRHCSWRSHIETFLQGYEGSLLKVTSKNGKTASPVGFVTFNSRAGADAAKQDLQVRNPLLQCQSHLLHRSANLQLDNDNLYSIYDLSCHTNGASCKSSRHTSSLGLIVALAPAAAKPTKTTNFSLDPPSVSFTRPTFNPTLSCHPCPKSGAPALVSHTSFFCSKE